MSYCLLLFDDGVYHAIKSINVKRKNNSAIAKWKNNSWYNAQLICISSEEGCQSVAFSLNEGLPSVVLHKLDLPLVYENNQGMQEDYRLKISSLKPLHSTPEGKNEGPMLQIFSIPNDIDLEQRTSFEDGPEITYTSNSVLMEEQTKQKDTPTILNNTYTVESPFNENEGENNLNINNTFVVNEQEQEITKQLTTEQEITRDKKRLFISADQGYNSDDSVQDKDYIPSSDSESSDYENDKNGTTDLICDGTLMKNKPLVISDTDNLMSKHKQKLLATIPQKNLDAEMSYTHASKIDICDVPSSISTSKKYFCVYCKKEYSKLPRHLQSVHGDVEDVQKFVSLPKGCKERKEILDIIRKNGDFLYNTNSLYNKGVLKVTRRPQEKNNRTPEHYVVCPSCKGFYSKLTIRLHYRHCSKHYVKGSRNILILGRAVRGRLHSKANYVLREKVFPVLRESPAIREIAYDDLAITYANKMCLKLRFQHQHSLIRTHLRLLGKFMLILKQNNANIIDLANALQPKYFDSVLEAVNILARFDRETGKYIAPTTALNMGTILKKCCNVNISECIKNEDHTKKSTCENFLKLLQEDYGLTISSAAAENQSEIRRQKVLPLPTTKEICQFTDYVVKKQRETYKNVKKNFSFKLWKLLASYTLIYLQSFNRRRAGEIERMQLADFKCYQSVDKITGTEDASTVIKDPEVASKYVRIEIRGKLGRTVQVIMNTFSFQCLKFVIRHRKEVGVSETNPFVFGIPGGEKRHKYLQACELMRKISKESGLKRPEVIRGTKLRKHIATINKNENITGDGSNVSHLASHLGHSVSIHKNIYQTTDPGNELSTMPKILERASGLYKKDTSNSWISSECDSTLEDSTKISDTTSSTSFTLSDESIDKNLKNISKGTGKKKVNRSVSPIGHVKRKSWSTPEKNSILVYFRNCIKNETIPNTEKCEEFIMETSSHRTVPQVKSWLSNQIQKRRKGIMETATSVRTTWTSEEKAAVKRQLSYYLKNNKLPSINECTSAIACEPILENRKPMHVKAWINNELKRIQKNNKIRD